MNDIVLHYKAHTDFLFFCKDILGYKEDKSIDYKELTEEHEDLCKFLQDGKKKSKIILMPRYSFKSGICTCGYSLWKLVRNPNLRILIYSDSATKASGFLTDIKNHILGKAPNSKFSKYFPDWASDAHSGKWNDSIIEVTVREHGIREPSVDTGGIESSKIGKHYDIIIFDDIVSDLNTTTKAQMDKIHDCYKKALSLLKPGGEILIIGTRWHYGDAYGRIIAENKEKENFALFIRDAEMVKEGKLLFEGIGLTREFLDYQRAEQGSYIYSCLYRNSPCDDETAIFKEKDFVFYKPQKEYSKDFFITATVDPAGEGDDFTAMVVVGTDDKRRVYILDAIQAHLKPSAIINQIIMMSYKWKFVKVGIETNFYRGTLEEDLKRAIEGERENKLFSPFSVEKIQATSKTRNFNRILALQPFHERRDLYFPNENSNFCIQTLNSTMSELAFQMMQFTIDGSKSPHDDLLVALALQTDILKPGGKAAESKAPYSSAAWYESKYLMGRQNTRIPLKYRKQYQPIFN